MTRGGDEATGNVSEVFRSIQGEGVYVGLPQVFVRLAGCDERCRWCDTRHALEPGPTWVVRGPGRDERPNPATAGAVAAAAADLAGGAVRTASLTGGEPLAQPVFAAAVAEALRARGLAVHLETRGTDAEALARVAPHVAVVAMDVKLPSAVGGERWAAHRRFLDVARGAGLVGEGPTGPRLFVKVVVDERADADEVRRAARLVAAAAPGAPLVVQPETRVLVGRGRAAADAAAFRRRLAGLAEAAAGEGVPVRVIPQCHRILGVR